MLYQSKYNSSSYNITYYRGVIVKNNKNYTSNNFIFIKNNGT